MKRETLSNIKEELKKFYILINSLNNYLCKDNSFAQYKLLEVLLQNAQFVSEESSVEEEETNLRTILQKIKQISDYENSYYERYIYNTVSMIIMSNVFSEE